MKSRSVIYSVFLLVIILIISGCKTKGTNSSSSMAHLYIRVYHDFSDKNDDKGISLNLVLDKPILVRDISMKAGTKTWEIAKPINNNVYSLNDNNEIQESIDVEFTNDSLSALVKPKIEDYPDTYGTDWLAYERDSSKYALEIIKYRTMMMEKFMNTLKANDSVTFELRGKIKNITVSIPKKEIESILKVWDVYKQM